MFFVIFLFWSGTILTTYNIGTSFIIHVYFVVVVVYFNALQGLLLSLYRTKFNIAMFQLGDLVPKYL